MDLCREKGVVRLAFEGTEIVLGPPPALKDAAAKAKGDPLATRREYYVNMLGRPVGDKELELLP